MPRAGLRSSPTQEALGVSDITQRLVLGLLRSPARGKPAHHNKPARDIDGIVHTIPFSEIKSIKNYSREFGYAIFRVAIPYNMEIDDAIKLMRDVGQKMRNDPLQRRNIWSPLEIQGVESFESGSAILRARFKTAPIKQWEVSRAFNLSLKRHLDDAGLDLATPRLSVQVVTGAAGGLEKDKNA